MDLVCFTEHDAPRPAKDPVFLEGLPGVGNVGKLAADHLVDVLEAKLWFTITSRDFPPQVMVLPDGTVRSVRAQLWVAPGAAAGRDLIVLTGDFQPLTAEGQYGLVEEVLDRLQATGCKELYTLGGYGLGSSVDDPDVLGAATDLKMVQTLKDAGVRFDDEEPGGGIIGASGLFLGVGMERGLRGACLMGETSGYLVDPKAARALLSILEKLLGIEGLDAADLDDKARELDRIAQQLAESEAAMHRPGEHTDLHYIG